MRPKQCLYIVATYDTKKDEAEFIKSLIIKTGLNVKTIDVSTQVFSSIADINNDIVAAHHPQGKNAVFCGDRGKAIGAMSLAFQAYLLAQTDVAGIIGLGGSGGTAIISPALQALPIGTPKLMVSTMASGDVSNYIGASDINILYSVTDIAGINRISRKVLINAAHQIAGAVYFQAQALENDKPAIGLTMFGVTTPCITGITQALNDQYDCIVFHATGAGGKSMEKLIDSKLLSGVFDITTTEVCDYLFGGVLACDGDRFGAIAREKIPAVLSCGALDMINFGHKNTIPEHHQDRLFYEHNEQVTLMRTTAKENALMGQWIGDKLNRCAGPIRFLIPLKGFSALDKEGAPFWSPEANKTFITALEATLQQNNHRQIIKLPYHINDPEFIQAALENFKEIATQA